MVLDGRAVATNIYEQLKKDLNNRKLKSSVILVGDDPASITYTNIKKKRAEELGIELEIIKLPANTDQQSLEKIILDHNKDESVQGLLVQLPLPKEFDTQKIITMIDPSKDIDGFNGKYSAPTAAAILAILDFYKIELQNKVIVLVGHGQLVGRPLEKLLIDRGLNPVVCDSSTVDLPAETIKADILVSATGNPGLITKDMVKDGAVVIDAGTAESNGKMVGDVSPEVYELNINYTPNPGGVGPVTVASLLKNLLNTLD